MSQTITLSKVEQKICRYIARMRFENNRRNQIVNSRIGDQSDEFTDLEGFAGELAFCKLLNVYPDFSINKRSVFSDKADGHFGPFTIDVKTTKYSTGKLLAAPWKNSNAITDFYALMVGEFPTYTFKGFIRREDLIKTEKIVDLGHGRTYAAKQFELF